MDNIIELLEDYSKEDIVENYIINNISKDKEKSFITLQPSINNVGDKIVILSINIPLPKDSLKIDLIINNELFQSIKNNFE